MAKDIKGQTRLQIALQTLDRGRIDLLIFFDKGCHGLISRLPIFLVEQGSQFRLDLLLLFVGNGAEHVVHFMHHTPLSGSRAKFGRNRIEHGLVAIDSTISQFL